MRIRLVRLVKKLNYAKIKYFDKTAMKIYIYLKNTINLLLYPIQIFPATTVRRAMVVEVSHGVELPLFLLLLAGAHGAGKGEIDGVAR